MARAITNQGTALPTGFDADATDAELLCAVVDYWHRSLLAADDRGVLLGDLGITVEVAESLRIGLSDRTLGLQLPGRQWKAGGILRSRLSDLGIMRSSGHEAFRGCVVVPVTDASGAVVGVFGNRTDHRFEGARAAVWTDGLPGGVFSVDGAEPGGPTLVVRSVLDALAVIGAGWRSVVAPGRERGFTGGDLATVAALPGELVVMGRDTDRWASELSALGASVAVAATGMELRAVLGSASVPADALAALVADRQVLVPADGPNQTDPVAVLRSQAPATVVATEGRDEVFVHVGSRSWRIRGAGARANTEGELLRVALSVTDASTGRFHLDTLDLYVAQKRHHFLDAVVTELRASREVLSAELAEVIVAAEQCRDEAGAAAPTPAPVMTDAERDEAMAWLSEPELLDRLGGDLGAMGVVGERTNLVVCYLATISRLCERPFGVLVQSSSSAGKSTVTEAVCSLVPSEDLVSLSAITSQALYYLDSGGLARKVLSVAEEHGATRASYALKLLVSEGRLSIATTGKDRSTGRLATSSYEISGPVALVMTTTATDIDPELENRLVVLGVDEDPAQTQAVVDAQRRAATLDGLAARSVRDRLRRLHANTQRLLDPFPVVIPDVGAGFPATSTRHRRDHMKLLSIISAVTLLHQHQRERRTVEVAGETVTYLEATEEDVATGLELASRVLVRRADNLAPQTARLLRAVEDHATTQAAELDCQASEVAVTRRELRELLGWSEIQIRRATDRLVALEYLVPAGGGRGRCRTYHYVAEIGPVGHPNHPVGHQGRPTGNPSDAGQADQLVRLVGLDESHITNGAHVHEDGKVARGKRRS